MLHCERDIFTDFDLSCRGHFLYRCAAFLIHFSSIAIFRATAGENLLKPGGISQSTTVSLFCSRTAIKTMSHKTIFLCAVPLLTFSLNLFCAPVARTFAQSPDPTTACDETQVAENSCTPTCQIIY
ncbi:MAG: hypothetical protein QF408_15825, partial [Pirellulales bacterium]|nr:hypothetical protein [Pirellulales bacterium]